MLITTQDWTRPSSWQNTGSSCTSVMWNLSTPVLLLSLKAPPLPPPVSITCPLSQRARWAIMVLPQYWWSQHPRVLRRHSTAGELKDKLLKVRWGSVNGAAEGGTLTLLVQQCTYKWYKKGEGRRGVLSCTYGVQPGGLWPPLLSLVACGCCWCGPRDGQSPSCWQGGQSCTKLFINDLEKEASCQVAIIIQMGQDQGKVQRTTEGSGTIEQQANPMSDQIQCI